MARIVFDIPARLFLFFGGFFWHVICKFEKRVTRSFDLSQPATAEQNAASQSVRLLLESLGAFDKGCKALTQVTLGRWGARAWTALEMVVGVKLGANLETGLSLRTKTMLIVNWPRRRT